MKARFRLFSIGIAGAALAAAVVPSVATAQDGDTDVSYFVGATTQLTPVLLVGGAGFYTFTTVESGIGPNGFCSGQSSDGEMGACALTSTGEYWSTVCGTGMIAGSVTLTESDGATDTFDVTGTFVSGQGVVTGGGFSAYVQIAPVGAANPPVCATAYIGQGFYTAS